jgi:hypothetical protein
VPTENGVLVDQAAASPVMIPAPRYSPEFLVRVGGVTIEHARLLANGMQEFVLRLGN